MPFKDITGQRFGNLVAIRPHHKDRSWYWLCQCDCGNEAIVSRLELGRVEGGTKSCGCLKGRNPTHGQSHTLTYDIWSQMLQRCNNPNNKRYNQYGGRGIRVCERWHKFENFLADMGECPSGYSIERINNDGDYEPGNCIWIPFSEQSKNKQQHKDYVTMTSAIVKLIEEAPDAIGPDEIASVTGLKHSHVRVTLTRLVRDGAIKRISLGRYVKA